MFRFVALFALVAVACAEPEADAQFLVNPINTVVGAPVVNTYGNLVNPQVPRIVSPAVYNQVVPVVKQVVKPIQYHVPVVKQVVKPVQYQVPQVYSQVPVAVPTAIKYVDEHHTEGMTADGVPEKTDSVKIAEKQHELAKTIADSKAKVAYVAPYNTYAGVYPYVHNVAHVVAKREADSESEAEPYVTYNGLYGAAINPLATTYGAPYNTYNTAVAGFPYTTAVSGIHYQNPYVASSVVYRGKRDADSQYFNYALNTPYAYNYSPYRYNYAPLTSYTNGYYY